MSDSELQALMYGGCYEQLESLWLWIPERYKETNLMQLFCTATDGYKYALSA